MKINQKGKGNDNFETPIYIYNQLNEVYNFTLDVACTSINKKCVEGYMFDKGLDSLLLSWKNERCFCNPPFSQKAEFIRKAHDEVLGNGCPLCVMILPLNSMDSKAFHEYIFGKFSYEILQGRISFVDPCTGRPKKGNNSGSVIVYFKKRIRIKNEN